MPGEKHCENKVSCSRTHHNDARQGSNLDHSIQRQGHQPWNHHTFHKIKVLTNKILQGKPSTRESNKHHYCYNFTVTCLGRLAECSFDLHVSKFSFVFLNSPVCNYEQNDYVLHSAILCPIADFQMVESCVSFWMECTSSMSQEKKLSKKAGQGHKPQADQVWNTHSFGGKKQDSNIVEVYF